MLPKRPSSRSCRLKLFSCRVSLRSASWSTDAVSVPAALMSRAHACEDGVAWREAVDAISERCRLPVPGVITTYQVGTLPYACMQQDIAFHVSGRILVTSGRAPRGGCALRSDTT